MRARGAIALTAAGLAAISAFVLIVGGAVALVINSQRDDSGYLSSKTTNYDTPSYALATRSYRAGSIGDVAVPARLLGDVRVQVHSKQPVFVGIGRAADVSRYLSGVRHARVTGIDDEDIHEYNRGHVTPGAPSEQQFWVAKSNGSGVQNLKWPAREGRWRAVVMDTKGTAHVEAGVALGAEVPHVGRKGLIALIGGLVLAVGAALLIRVGARDV
jgi:hypothetical protein